MLWHTQNGLAKKMRDDMHLERVKGTVGADGRRPTSDNPLFSLKGMPPAFGRCIPEPTQSVSQFKA
jgi:hypothetical protein